MMRRGGEDGGNYCTCMLVYMYACILSYPGPGPRVQHGMWLERFPREVERVPWEVERFPWEVERFPREVERLPREVERFPSAFC